MSVCPATCTRKPECNCGSQRKTFRSWFSPSTMWVPVIELGPSGLAAILLSCQPSLEVFSFDITSKRKPFYGNQTSKSELWLFAAVFDYLHHVVQQVPVYNPKTTRCGPWFFFSFFSFQDKVSLCNSPGCPGTCSLDQAGFKLIEMPLPPSTVIKGMCHHCLTC